MARSHALEQEGYDFTPQQLSDLMLPFGFNHHYVFGNQQQLIHTENLSLEQRRDQFISALYHVRGDSFDEKITELARIFLDFEIFNKLFDSLENNTNALKIFLGSFIPELGIFSQYETPSEIALPDEIDAQKVVILPEFQEEALVTKSLGSYIAESFPNQPSEFWNFFKPLHLLLGRRFGQKEKFWVFLSFF